MTDDRTPNERDDALDPDLAAMLSAPGMWEEPDLALEDSIVAAITAEAAVTGARPLESVIEATDDPVPSDNVIPIGRARRWIGPALAGAAAAVILVLGVQALEGQGGSDVVEVTLAGTDLAPEASATAAISTPGAGTRIILDVAGLEPAPDGQYYEAWLRKDAEVGVSAGTFHLRSGDSTIELWAGVNTSDYPLLTVTLQDEAQTESSGKVVLKVLLGEESSE